MIAKDVHVAHTSFTNRKWKNFIHDILSLFWRPKVQALPYSMWLHLTVRWYTQLADFAWRGSRLLMVLGKKCLISLSARTTVFMSCQFCYFFPPSNIETKFQRFQHPVFRDHWRNICYCRAAIGLNPGDAEYISRFKYHPHWTRPWQWFENVENPAPQMYWYSSALPSSGRSTLPESTQRPVRTLGFSWII